MADAGAGLLIRPGRSPGEVVLSVSRPGGAAGDGQRLARIRSPRSAGGGTARPHDASFRLEEDVAGSLQHPLECAQVRRSGDPMHDLRVDWWRRPCSPQPWMASGRSPRVVSRRVRSNRSAGRTARRPRAARVAAGASSRSGFHLPRGRDLSRPTVGRSAAGLGHQRAQPAVLDGHRTVGAVPLRGVAISFLA